ncbi:MAG TPA: PilN domain-containing protein [Holophaga sp.]|nr:PilN domain-containing protein [Holophaga sp.]HPS66356.1 PilN domain-containing protein [Holophaga sp.]
MIKINLMGETLAPASGKKPETTESVQVYGQEEEAARSSFPLAGILVGLFFVAFGVVYYIGLNQKVEEQTQKKADLERQKAELAKYVALEAKFRKDRDLIEKKKNVIKNLRIMQHLPVHLMEELANALPDDVWFQEITQKGAGITIRGESASFEAINLFRTHLMDQAAWFANVNYPTANKRGNVVEFTLSFDLKKPS